MTRRWLSVLVVAVLASGCAWTPGGRGTTGAAEADLASDPVARAETEATLAILERMSTHLASLGAFRFRAEVRYDAVQESGQRIEFGSERRIAVQRPDRIRVDVAHWDGGSELMLYDGAQLAAASPALHVYALTPQSGPLAEALDRVQRELGVPTPLAELLDSALYEKLRAAVESGVRAGLVRLDGRVCHQLAFRAPGLDFQLFVEQGETPWPRRLVIDYREEPGRPQFRASLRDWEPAAELPEGLFLFAPPIGAQRVPFEELLDLLEGGVGSVAAREPGEQP
jgi:hypothetical protein